MQWGEVSSIAPVTPAVLQAAKRGGLPMEWLLHRYGFPAEMDGSRLVLSCPFHADSRPSFTIRLAEDGTEIAGCWSCPDKQQGDLFDLIRWLTGVPTFAAAVALLPRFAAEFAADSSWQARPRRVLQPAPKADPAELAQLAAEAYACAVAGSPVLQALIDWKRQTDAGWRHLTPEFLMSEWHVGAVPDRTSTRQLSNPDAGAYSAHTRVVPGRQIVVPHFDAEGVCRALKTRYVGGKLISWRGSDLSHLYGSWKPQRFGTVLVCEGESDAWVASSVLRDRVDVRALPSGTTGPKPQWTEYLRSWPDIVLAFDGDDAGRKALAQWMK